MGTDDVLGTLRTRFGRTYADELGIDLDGSPSSLFQMLVGAILMSTRIGSDLAASAARALWDAGMTTAGSMAEASWQDRVDALSAGNYDRYRERTADDLGDTCEYLLERYDGDLRRLRDDAEQDAERERELLKELKGLGDVGVDIFFREVQHVWQELRPFADERALEAAGRLDLGSSAHELAELIGDDDLSELTAALVRVELNDAYDEVREGRKVPEGELDEEEARRLTKDELYDLARERDIEGRSEMTKDELVDAITS